jgi:RNA polymerase sigma-70 factor, ECF subfamily
MADDRLRFGAFAKADYGGQRACVGCVLTVMDAPSVGVPGSALDGSADLLKREPAGVLQYVRRTVLRTCPAKLAHKAEDIIQVVMLRVLEIQRQQGEIRTASYLARAAYSVMVDEIRRQLKRPESSLDSVETNVLEQTTAIRSHPPDDLRDLGKSIRECLQGLAEQRQMAVVLYLQGFTAEEAQRSLGWNLKKIRNLTYRGMAELRACLEGKGFNE